MKRIMIIAALATTPVAAQSTDCSAIENGADRLACFDAQSGRQQPEPTAIGNWEVADYSSPRGMAAIATTLSENPVQCGQTSEQAILTIDCTGELPTMYVSLSCRVARPGSEIHTTFDHSDGFSRGETFYASPDGRSLGTWSNDIHAVRGLSDGRVDISFIGADVTLTPAIFDLQGTDELQEHLYEQGRIWRPKQG